MKFKKIFRSIFSVILVLVLVLQTAAGASPENTALQDSSPVDTAVKAITAFLKEYKSGINNINVYLKDAGGNLQEFYAEYDDDSGSHHTWKSNVFYNTKTQIIYGKDNNGALALGFDWDLSQMVLYTPTNSWQRGFGFCELYDIFSPAAMFYYKTIRFKFRYGDKDWLIQLWKGQYSVTIGAELGIYNKPADREEEFYDCASDDCMMPVSLKLYKWNKLVFERPLQTHWWMTGFKAGICLPFELKMLGSIEFPCAEMKDAFTDACGEKYFTSFKYTVQGNTVNFVW